MPGSGCTLVGGRSTSRRFRARILHGTHRTHGQHYRAPFLLVSFTDLSVLGGRVDRDHPTRADLESHFSRRFRASFLAEDVSLLRERTRARARAKLGDRARCTWSGPWVQQDSATRIDYGVALRAKRLVAIYDMRSIDSAR